jgi:hypothetical protein
MPEATAEVAMTPIPTFPEPADAGAQQLIVKARSDLSARLGVPVEEIGLVDFQSVTWPDGGLGCPKPGMGYTQVLVEGYLIRLSVGKRVFQYHGAGGRDPFYCENPDPAVTPLRSDQ